MLGLQSEEHKYGICGEMAFKTARADFVFWNWVR
jgi:hypothetical protein